MLKNVNWEQWNTFGLNSCTIVKYPESLLSFLVLTTEKTKAWYYAVRDCLLRCGRPSTSQKAKLSQEYKTRIWENEWPKFVHVLQHLFIMLSSFFPMHKGFLSCLKIHTARGAGFQPAPLFLGMLKWLVLLKRNKPGSCVLE